jgi:hypothetical protein
MVIPYGQITRGRHATGPGMDGRIEAARLDYSRALTRVSARPYRPVIPPMGMARARMDLSCVKKFLRPS